MTKLTRDGGTIFKALPGQCPWKVRAVQVVDLQEDVLEHQIVDVGTPDRRIATTSTNRDATATHTTPLNNPFAEAAGKKRFP